MKVNLAVFDIVGTTVRAGDEVPSSFSEALRSVGITLSDDAIARIRGRSKREAISDLLSEHGEGPEGADEVYACFRTALQTAYRRRAQSIPGVEDVFRFLQRAGVKVVLTTGLDRESAELLFNGLGWGSLGLSGMVTGDDVKRGRPAPDLINAAMALAGVADAGSVVVIGDTTSDLDAAAAARVGWSIGVLTGAHSRSQLVHRFRSSMTYSHAATASWSGSAAAQRATRRFRSRRVNFHSKGWAIC